MKFTFFAMTTLVCLMGLLGVTSVQASDARTSASASGGGRRPGSATATASYEGDVGFARTQTRSGPLTASRAVAVGVDEDGLSLSISTAMATPVGPAFATNFNLSIGRDGDLAHSVGHVISTGGLTRSATAGGAASAGPRRGVSERPTLASASSRATGTTTFGGVVRATTRSYQEPRVVVVRPISWRP